MKKIEIVYACGGKTLKETYVGGVNFDQIIQRFYSRICDVATDAAVLVDGVVFVEMSKEEVEGA